MPIVDRPIADAIALAWLLLTAAGAVRLIRRTRRTRALRGSLVEMIDGVEVRVADDIASPLTNGRAIFLPRFLGDAALRNAAIRHELAHIRHRDSRVQLGIEIASLPLLFQPAIHLLRRRLAELREMRCDEAASAGNPRDYARALLAIGRLATADAGGIDMASTALERRIVALRTSPRRTVRGGTLLALALIVVATLAACRKPVRFGAGLSGNWELDRAATDFGPVEPYRAFTMTLDQAGQNLTMSQHRVLGSAAEDRTFHLVTDGRPRPVDGVRNSVGSARWNGARLELDLHAPGHRERSSGYVDARGRLICEGTIGGGSRPGSYHFVFRRIR